MDFLKKHYEKITLAVVLLVLIVTGVWLAIKVGDLSREISEGPKRPPFRGTLWQGVPLAPYSNALARLDSPIQWTNVPQPLFPLPTVVAVSTTQDMIVVPKSLPFTIENVFRETFELLFKNYSYDAERKEGYNFQVNLHRNRSYFIRAVNDPIGATVYKVVKFEYKTREVDEPSTGSKRIIDVSELTIKRPDRDGIVLVVGQETLAKEPVAIIRCRDEQPVRAIPTSTFNCASHPYKVVDISRTQVIIVDTLSGEKHTIELGAGALGNEGGERPPPPKRRNPAGMPPGPDMPMEDKAVPPP